MRRFTTPSGEFVGLRHLPNGALALGQAILRKLCGYIPIVPWIPFAARKRLQGVLTPTSVVWEIGSGFSTIWLSKRAASITSIEADKGWHEKLKKIMAQKRIRNVDLRYEWVAERMADFADVADESVDLLFVDGGPRSWCLHNGFGKVKRGGAIYLDNWENAGFWEGAREFLDEQKNQIEAIERFIDYVPAQFGVYESLLVVKK
jgi:predicted O-methyltransferase YrrM